MYKRLNYNHNLNKNQPGKTPTQLSEIQVKAQVNAEKEEDADSIISRRNGWRAPCLMKEQRKESTDYLLREVKRQKNKFQ